MEIEVVVTRSLPELETCAQAGRHKNNVSNRMDGMCRKNGRRREGGSSRGCQTRQLVRHCVRDTIASQQRMAVARNWASNLPTKPTLPGTIGYYTLATAKKLYNLYSAGELEHVAVYSSTNTID